MIIKIIINEEISSAKLLKKLKDKIKVKAKKLNLPGKEFVLETLLNSFKFRC
jgi:hypothetical protein